MNNDFADLDALLADIATAASDKKNAAKRAAHVRKAASQSAASPEDLDWLLKWEIANEWNTDYFGQIHTANHCLLCKCFGRPQLAGFYQKLRHKRDTNLTRYARVGFADAGDSTHQPPIVVTTTTQGCWECTPLSRVEPELVTTYNDKPF